MWDTLERRQVRAIVTLRTGEQYFALNGRNDLSSDLPKQTPEKETTHFVKIEYLAFAKVAGQPPEVILPAPIPVDVNVNEIARVERFANPYLEASFIGKTPQETESFRQLQNQPGAEREREFASAR
jgi:N-glycosylase/DNA lyase